MAFMRSPVRSRSGPPSFAFVDQWPSAAYHAHGQSSGRAETGIGPPYGAKLSRGDTSMKISRAPLFAIALLMGQGWLAGQVKPDPFSFALTGDSIITRKVSVYKEPEFLRM